MKTTIIVIPNNGSKAVEFLKDTLNEYCVHTITNGSAELANPEVDKRAIMEELREVSRIARDLKDGQDIYIPACLIPSIISFMGLAKLYNPESIIILTTAWLAQYE